MKFKLDNKSINTLEWFINIFVDKYYNNLSEEIIGQNTVIKRERNYKNKIETKETLASSINNLISELGFNEKIDDIIINSSRREGLSMYATIKFNIRDIPLNIPGRGRLNSIIIRISDHPPHRTSNGRFPVFDYNFIVRNKTLNDIKEEIKQIIENHLEEIETFKKEHNITEILKLRIREF